MRSRLHQTAVVFSMEKGKYFAVQIFRLAIYMFNFAQNMGQIENDFITTNILTHWFRIRQPKSKRRRVNTFGRQCILNAKPTIGL